MVPLSGRRHRLYEREIPEVVAGLKLRLDQLLWEQEDKEKAMVAFRCLHRLLGGGVGRPKYPEFSWDYLGYFLGEGVEDANR